MHRPPLPPGSIPGTHFCYRLRQPQGPSAAGRFMSIKNFNDTIRNRTRNLPACTVCTVGRRYYVPTPVGRGERKFLFSFRGILLTVVVSVQERFHLPSQLQGLVATRNGFVSQLRNYQRDKTEGN